MSELIRSGRFNKKISDLTAMFVESISFDKRLAKYDIQGSIAHTQMLAKCKIIHFREADKIIKGLKEIGKEIETGKFKFDIKLEDIHFNIESRLKEKIGALAGKLHTARSRNDQVALDIRLFLRDKIKTHISKIQKLQILFLDIAEKNINVMMPGYTHLQPAQPVSLAHHLLSYYFMFQRDRERFEDVLKRVNVMPLGSAALAGTSFPIDRNFTARMLGFKEISQNSMDAVSDRDFALDYLYASSVLMMHLSRLSEELILWSTREFGFIEIDDAFTTGSSIMPQKKNPDVAELVRGKTGRVYGNLIALLTIMKSLPLTYNRDMQEDKEAVFDSIDTVENCLGIYIAMLPSIIFNKRRLREAAELGFLEATDVADYLVKKGIPFREAHRITGNIVQYCLKQNIKLNDLTIDRYKLYSYVFNSDVYKHISLTQVINSKKSYGGTSIGNIRKTISKERKKIKINAFK